ncbi:hypothetical protein EV421DRAFT_1913080 [Armillaria borealis]|uniref:Uncharacterized protein n=1 Tax=Armillaria borealis TaxID=47425 RepID=A0AA39ITQ4_9AGAR|nr:hypothetical protein EV421DRAFT_1913080 [Armillaria borealis]
MPPYLPYVTVQSGPGVIYSQWAIERTIGNVGQEVKQHSNVFANLEQRGIHRSQINALKAMIPDFDPPMKALPHCSIDLGGGYVLLPARDTASRPVHDCEAAAMSRYIASVESMQPEHSQTGDKAGNGHS